MSNPDLLGSEPRHLLLSCHITHTSLYLKFTTFNLYHASFIVKLLIFSDCQVVSTSLVSVLHKHFIVDLILNTRIGQVSL